MSGTNEMIVTTSGKALKLLKAAKVLAVVMLVIASVSLVVCIAGAVVNPDIGTWLVEHHIINLEGKDFQEWVNAEMAEDAYTDMINELLGAVVECVLALVVVGRLKKTFDTIAQSGEPFAEETLKEIKIAFILLFVVVMIADWFAGLAVGATFLCMYNIFKHGVELQKETEGLV